MSASIERRGRLGANTARNTVLVVGAAIMVTPFLYMLSTSFKAQQYVLTTPPQFIPDPLTASNYSAAWQSNHFGRYFVNSLVVAVVSTALSLALSSMMAKLLMRLGPSAMNARAIDPSSVTAPRGVSRRQIWIRTWSHVATQWSLSRARILHFLNTAKRGQLAIPPVAWEAKNCSDRKCSLRATPHPILSAGRSLQARACRRRGCRG